ncbi:MAG TPA: SDR family NAD(P)-dependent oxidoreductase, partial [Bacillota bacterium]
PQMKERRSGHIINVASVAGLVTFPRGAGYCASKWGMIALTETLMQELKPYELKVSAVCPGSVRTDFGGTPPRDYALRPEDVAEMVAMVAAQPRGVIINQVVMRPLVPQALQASGQG